MTKSWRSLIPSFVKVFVKQFILGKYKRETKLVEYQGLKLNLNYSSDIERFILNSKAFEPHLVELSKDFIKEGDIVFDVGANVGIHTTLFSQLVGNTGKVIAFEPNEINLERLYLNLQLNQIENVEVVEKAVGESVKEYDFYELDISSEFTGHHSLVYTETLEEFARTNKINQRKILGTSIDDFSGENGLVPSFLKMDIEGYEYFALKGAQKMLKKADRLTMIIEFNSLRIKSIGLDNFSFIDILRDFDCYEILGPDLYNDFTSLVKYNFDRDIKCDLLCIKSK